MWLLYKVGDDWTINSSARKFTKGVDNETMQYATDSLRNKVTRCTSPARIAPLYRIIIFGLILGLQNQVIQCNFGWLIQQEYYIHIIGWSMLFQRLMAPFCCEGDKPVFGAKRKFAECRLSDYPHINNCNLASDCWTILHFSVTKAAFTFIILLYIFNDPFPKPSQLLSGRCWKISVTSAIIRS